MAQVEILEEREGPAGWTYDAQVLDDEGGLTRHEVGLAWADYNLWSPSGIDEPSSVCIAALMVLLSRLAPADLRPRFDLSIVRRLVPDADRLVPTLVR